VSFATGVWTFTSNVWSFLHRFTLGAAILSGGYIAGTDGMGAFLAISHWVSFSSNVSND
jgi:hypothetical protein